MTSREPRAVRVHAHKLWEEHACGLRETLLQLAEQFGFVDAAAGFGTLEYQCVVPHGGAGPVGVLVLGRARAASKCPGVDLVGLLQFVVRRALPDVGCASSRAQE